MRNEWWRSEPGESQPDGMDLNFAGRLALTLVEKWGMVCGVQDGEDSVGRRAYAEMPVPAVIERAFTLAEACVTALEERGWIRPVEMTAEQAWQRKAELQRAYEDTLYRREEKEAAGG